MAGSGPISGCLPRQLEALLQMLAPHPRRQRGSELTSPTICALLIIHTENEAAVVADVGDRRDVCSAQPSCLG